MIKNKILKSALALVPVSSLIVCSAKPLISCGSFKFGRIPEPKPSPTPDPDNSSTSGQSNNSSTNGETTNETTFNKLSAFKTNYNTIESLDKNPAVFNDTDKFLVEDLKGYRPQWMFNDPYKSLYIGGVKSYYDYVLQINKHGNTSQIKKRYERLKSDEKVLGTKQEKRLGTHLTEASTYNLDELAEIYGEMYNGHPAAKKLYGFNIFYFGSPKYQDFVSPDDFNWLSFDNNKESDYGFYSFDDMHTYSKRFYERTDRHFLQRRINTAYSDPNHPLHIKSVKGYQHSYKGGYEGFDLYYNDNYYANGTPDKKDPIGVFVLKSGGCPDGRWDPAGFYGNEFYMSPFRAIMNSNISSLSLKLLANWVDFNLNLMNMLNDDKKTFYELIDNPTFKNTLNSLKISALELLKPTNYANWVEEGTSKPYKFFSDEIDLMKGSKSLSPEGEPSNQRQFYKLALHIYNQV
ncbi:hypothetical protein, partial [Mycoplasmopsis primatum]|uniref:hypothetical protein n=1 Tax=Mycoplasmopsis primatum TaxID=55604 RepID=UPI0004967ACF